MNHRSSAAFLMFASGFRYKVIHNNMLVAKGSSRFRDANAWVVGCVSAWPALEPLDTPESSSHAAGWVLCISGIRMGNGRSSIALLVFLLELLCLIFVKFWIIGNSFWDQGRDLAELPDDDEPSPEVEPESKSWWIGRWKREKWESSARAKWRPVITFSICFRSVTENWGVYQLDGLTGWCDWTWLCLMYRVI